tara:strand:+ start:55 stop:666 length:612 start_codon:yes stop_codon:yes gene_type:complete
MNTINEVAKHFESDAPDWNSFFSIVYNLYSDKGFASAADNFTRAIAVELGLERCSLLKRVDQKGYDFIYIVDGVEIKIELKMARNMFYKGVRKNNPRTTSHKFKVKSFLSEEKTVEDFKQEKTFDVLMVMDINQRRIVLVTDERARELYTSGADGAVMRLHEGDYYECELQMGSDVVENTQASLSSLYAESMNNYLDTFQKSA